MVLFPISLAEKKQAKTLAKTPDKATVVETQREHRLLLVTALEKGTRSLPVRSRAFVVLTLGEVVGMAWFWRHRFHLFVPVLRKAKYSRCSAVETIGQF